jgi:tetratricopeptide (TPR) repeat protein
MPGPTGTTPPLDDEDRADLSTFLLHLREHGASSLIITSRTNEAWLGDIHRIDAGKLTPSEAIDFADQLLGAYPHAQPRRAQRAFGELLERLDGNPLSLRLILPHLDYTDPQVLVERLQGVTAFPDSDQESAQLLASIDYSFGCLPPTDQDALTALVLFQGSADATVLGIFSSVPNVPDHLHSFDRDGWVAILDRAVAVGLLTRQQDGLQGIYQIHPALPAYLIRQWQARHVNDFNEQYDAATRSLLYAYQFLARMGSMQLADRGDRVAIAVIDANRRTLGSLLGYALDHQMWAHAEAIVPPLNAYWDIRGLTEEAGEWVNRTRRAVEDPYGTPPDLATVAGRLWRGLVFAEASRRLRAGQLDDAEDTYQSVLHAIQQYPAMPDYRLAVANTHHQLGRICQERGQWDQAESWYRQALVVFEEMGDRGRMGACFHQLGNVAYLRGALEDAEAWYRRSRALDEQLGDRPGMVNSYHQQSLLAQRQGRWSEAETLAQRSLTIAKELGDRPGIARSYHQLGALAYGRGLLEQAESWYRHCLVVEEELGDRSGIAGTFHDLGVVAHEQRHWDEAEAWYLQSLAFSEQLGDRHRMASSYHQLGILATNREQWTQAETRFRQALALGEELGDQTGLAGTYHQIGVLAYLQQRWDEAEAGYMRSLALNEQLGDSIGMSRTYHQLGMLAHRREQWTQAEAWYHQALTIKESLDTGSLASTYRLLAKLAFRQEEKLRSLEWLIELLNPRGRFPDTATESELALLWQLAADLGMETIESVWQSRVGSPLPHAVRLLLHTVESENDDIEGSTDE